MVLTLRGPLWVLGTIGATTPFLGLFGTVVGIMGAFRKIGESNQAGIQVVGPYIAEALIATAVGIGTALFYDPMVCKKVNAGISDYLRTHGLASVRELVGSLRTGREVLDTPVSG